MGRSSKIPLLLFLLASGLFNWGGQVKAQTFTVLHSFTALQNNKNSDGARPSAALILSGNTLYGTAALGGSSGNGTIFAINTDGTGFTNLYNFTAVSAFAPYTNMDGANPGGELLLSGNTLYGTAATGGRSGNGTVFKVNTNGEGFATIFSFAEFTGPPFTYGNSNGANPTGLVLSGNTLYGTTYVGGSSADGTVFAVNTDGTGFTNLHTFIFSDGAYPNGRLVLLGNGLYGTTTLGGRSGNGTVFKVNTDSTGFMSLHNLEGYPSDGRAPEGGLVLSGSTLYGTANGGGSSAYGTVFKINTDGSGYTNLHSFSGSDGRYLYAAVAVTGSTLYGTTDSGGIPGANGGSGTVFKLNTDGTGFTTLYTFSPIAIIGPWTNSDGSAPHAALILSGNTLFGTTKDGGAYGSGTVFSLSLPLTPPQLTITSSATNLVLTWPTNFTDYRLQSTTNLATPSWVTNLPAPSVVDGQNALTFPISGTQQFFRLAQ